MHPKIEAQTEPETHSQPIAPRAPLGVVGQATPSGTQEGIGGDIAAAAVADAVIATGSPCY